ncbi:hypothetical protein KIN20_009058 [Parelaphostrongylus tenuis]|nr:hypothetical protein KIN20_009058 [Parelaphostrongylus tenuis]
MSGVSQDKSKLDTHESDVARQTTENVQMDIELMKDASDDERKRDRDLAATERWVQNSARNASWRNDNKELLQYRGKLPDGTWCTSNPTDISSRPNEIKGENLDYNSDAALRHCKDRKELLQYRGKRPDGSWIIEDSSLSSSRQDENKASNSNTSQSDSGCDHGIFKFHGSGDLESEQAEVLARDQFGAGLVPLNENSPSLREERICRHCYEQYSQICADIGKPPRGINVLGIWRTHCQNDVYGNVTCPHLFFSKCGYCGATGQAAHMDKDCPMLKPEKSDVNSSK